jgi:hypothetical protein
MISPREIMRGSILSFEGKPQIVKGVAEYIIFEGRKEWIGGSLINGEPITEAWLTRFGFDMVQEGSMALPTIYRRIYCPVLVTTNFDVQCRGDFRWMEGNANVELIFVHQLQVLYFAVTGEHLKLPKLK